MPTNLRQIDPYRHLEAVVEEQAVHVDARNGGSISLISPEAYRTDLGRVTVAKAPIAFPIENMHDSYGRRINYLRISLTDACNLRCVYCMPEHMKFLPRHELMSDDEILFLVRVGASLGVNKIRLTGGEPTIRPNVVELVREIATVPGIKDIAMTTNGLLLDKLAEPLAEAGLNRVNISIDTLDPEKFHRITRWGHIEDVWQGSKRQRSPVCFRLSSTVWSPATLMMIQMW